MSGREQTGEKLSDSEYIEEEPRRSRIGNLKKKAFSCSTKLTHPLKMRKGKRKIDFQIPLIEDVRDEKEEKLVSKLRQQLLQKDLLPPVHDDYHMLLRYEMSYQSSFFSYIQLES
jgi:hypothetical protein